MCYVNHDRDGDEPEKGPAGANGKDDRYRIRYDKETAEQVIDMIAEGDGVIHEVLEM